MTPQSRTRLVSALRAVFAGARWRSLAQSLRQGAAASSVLRTYGSAAARSAGLSPRLRSFVQSVLLLPVVFVALIILFLAFWREHEARMRQTFELKALARQDAAQATALEARARAALMASEQRHAQALEDYDSQRRRLDREAQTLRQRLASLQAAERSQAERVATLPASNLANQVAARLGTLSHELTAENPPAHAFGPASGFNGPESPAGSQGTNVDSGAPPAEAEGPKASAAANFESPDAAAAGITIPQPELRSMAQALVQLDSCRQQAAVQDLQLHNCQESSAAASAMAAQLEQTRASLRQALDLKEQAMAAREAQHQAEIKAARGSWRTHLVHAAECFAVGVAVGVAIR